MSSCIINSANHSQSQEVRTDIMAALEALFRSVNSFMCGWKVGVGLICLGGFLKLSKGKILNKKKLDHRFLIFHISESNHVC